MYYAKVRYGVNLILEFFNIYRLLTIFQSNNTIMSNYTEHVEYLDDSHSNASRVRP